MTDGYWPTPMYTAPIIEYLIRGDFEKYGPRGTDQSDFTTEQIVPEAVCYRYCGFKLGGYCQQHNLPHQTWSYVAGQ